MSSHEILDGFHQHSQTVKISIINDQITIWLMTKIYLDKRLQFLFKKYCVIPLRHKGA